MDSMNRTIYLFLLYLTLCSCEESDKERITRLVKQWEGKEILFPENMVLTRHGVDTLDYQIPDANYTIVSYIDSVGCTTCKLQFPRWKQVMHEMDSTTNMDVSFLFIFHPKNKGGHKELIHLMKRNHFTNLVWVDIKGEFYKKNRLPIGNESHSFLINKQNKVMAIGSPYMNPRIRELYL